MIAAERMADPVVGHEDAAQARMPGERDAIEVVHLPLVPVRRRIERRDARDRYAVFDLDLESRARVVAKTVEEVDDVEAGLSLWRVVREEIHEKVVPIVA